MLRVLAVVDGARHLLLLLVVHLSIDVAVAWQLPKKQWRIGVLSPKPRTVAFVVFCKNGVIDGRTFFIKVTVFVLVEEGVQDATVCCSTTIV